MGKTNFDVIKGMDAKQLSWMFNCVFFAGVNLKVLQLCNEQGIDVPEISLPNSFDEYNPDSERDEVVENPFDTEWLLAEAEEALTNLSGNAKIPMPLGAVLLKMLKTTPEEYEKMVEEMSESTVESQESS
jgi:hypothetical protein